MKDWAVSFWKSLCSAVIAVKRYEVVDFPECHSFYYSFVGLRDHEKVDFMLNKK